MGQHDLQNILVMAARYAHTRQTGAALQVVNAIKNHWDNINEQTQKQIISEAMNEATCNSEDWAKLLSLGENISAQSKIAQLKSEIDDLVKTQKQSGNWNYDPYMHGMANGMLLVQSIVNDEECVYLDAPDKWLCDNEPECEQPCLQEGFYQLKVPHEKEPSIVYGYRCSDLNDRFVFGFNPHDGGGIVALDDLCDAAEVTMVDITCGAPIDWR